MTLRERANLVLVRMGIRKVLPACCINRIPVEECGEPLVDWRGEGLVREGVARRLDRAEAALPPGFSLSLRSGWRSAVEQAALRASTAKRTAPDELGKAVARKSGHETGGAVDVVLVRDGACVDMGGAYLDFPALRKRPSAGQSRNRRILKRAMAAAGFVNYPREWWHFCRGDRMWAAYANRRVAVYGETVAESPCRESGK